MKVVELRTKQVEDREQLDKIIATLTQLHTEGKLQSVMMYYRLSDGENFTWTSTSMKLNDMSWGIALLQRDLSRYIGDPT